MGDLVDGELYFTFIFSVLKMLIGFADLIVLLTVLQFHVNFLLSKILIIIIIALRNVMIYIGYRRQNTFFGILKIQ